MGGRDFQETSPLRKPAHPPSSVEFPNFPKEPVGPRPGRSVESAASSPSVVIAKAKTPTVESEASSPRVVVAKAKTMKGSVPVPASASRQVVGSVRKVRVDPGQIELFELVHFR